MRCSARVLVHPGWLHDDEPLGCTPELSVAADGLDGGTSSGRRRMDRRIALSSGGIETHSRRCDSRPTD
jgi:hypothetical protein